MLPLLSGTETVSQIHRWFPGLRNYAFFKDNIHRVASISILAIIPFHFFAGCITVFRWFSMLSSGVLPVVLFVLYISVSMLGIRRYYERVLSRTLTKISSRDGRDRTSVASQCLHKSHDDEKSVSSPPLQSSEEGDVIEELSPSARTRRDAARRKMRAMMADSQAQSSGRESIDSSATLLQQQIAEGEVLQAIALRKTIKLKNGRILRCGTASHAAATEVAVMKFIAENTTVPIPGNPEYIIDVGRSYVVRDYVEGQVLSKAWDHLQEHEKAMIIAELKGYVNQLRALKPPGYIGSLDRGRCRDCRMFSMSCGPFDNEAQFNNHLVSVLRTHLASPIYRMFLTRMMREDHKIVFTHADLHWNNIIVKDGHVAAIVDWEMAGWYPEYWEYCKALYNEKFDTDWCMRVRDFLEPYDYEYAVDKLLLALSPAW